MKVEWGKWTRAGRDTWTRHLNCANCGHKQYDLDVERQRTGWRYEIFSFAKVCYIATQGSFRTSLAAQRAATKRAKELLEGKE